MIFCAKLPEQILGIALIVAALVLLVVVVICSALIGSGPRTRRIPAWEVGQVQCDTCTHRWTAVRPVGTLNLECPHCRQVTQFTQLADE